jgi:hypothetical protein
VIDKLHEDCSFGELLYQKEVKKSGQGKKAKENCGEGKQVNVKKRRSVKKSGGDKKKKEDRRKNYSQKRIFKELTDQVFEKSEESLNNVFPKKEVKTQENMRNIKQKKEKKTQNLLKKNLNAQIDSIQEIKQKEVQESEEIPLDPFYQNREINRHSKQQVKRKENSLYQRLGKRVFGHEVQKLFELKHTHHFNSKYSETIKKPKKQIPKNKNRLKTVEIPKLKSRTLEPILIKTDRKTENPEWSPFPEFEALSSLPKDHVGLQCSLDSNEVGDSGSEILYKSGRHLIRANTQNKSQMIFGAGFVQNYLFVEELRLLFLCETVRNEPHEESPGMYNFNLGGHVHTESVSKISVFDYDTGFLRGHFFASVDCVLSMNYMFVKSQENCDELKKFEIPNEMQLNQVK